MSRSADVHRSRSALRPLAALMLCLVSSCAWSFQEHEPAYAPTHEPRCTAVPRWWLLDQFADDHVSDASARQPVGQRQQQLATMVLMGINHIIVTDGHINARLVTGGPPLKHRP